MVRDVMEGPGRIGMIQPVGGDEYRLHKIGCIGELVGVEELEDGRFNIVLHGASRFRLIDEADMGTAYRHADVEPDAFDDTDPPPLGLVARAEVEREARRLGDALRLSVDWQAVGRLDDEMLVNAIAQVAPFDVGAKQALLESSTLAERADLLVQLMQFQRLTLGVAAEADPTIQ
jgi:Lon protease-like protein